MVVAITSPPSLPQDLPHRLSVVPVTQSPDFRQVFEETYRPLVAYARRRTNTAADADDIVAETYTVAWRRWAELDADRDPLPWLYTVAGNVLRNHWRSNERRLRLVDRIESQPVAAPSADPSERQGAELREALEKLSPDDQEVLKLMAWEGLSHAEIGDVLGCSTNAVGIRIHRARQRLETELIDPTATPTPKDA